MINFTGTTKRRNINLGGSRRQKNGDSYLQQLSQDRLKRARAREEYNSAVVLQSAIRRYLELKESANDMYLAWDSAGETIGDESRDRVIAQYIFFSRFVKTDENLQLHKLYEYLQTARIDDNDGKRVYQQLSTRLIGNFSALLKSVDHKNVHILKNYLVLFKFIYNKINEHLKEIPIEILLQDLLVVVQNFGDGHSSDEIPVLAVEVLVQYSSLDRAYLVNFLGTIGSLPLFKTLDVDQRQTILELCQWISHLQPNGFPIHDNSISVMFLSSLVSLMRSYHLTEGPTATATIAAISTVLSSINAKMVFIKDLEEEDFNENVENLMVADYDVSGLIEFLYSDDFVDLLLAQCDSAQQLSLITSFIYSSLHIIYNPVLRPTNARLRNKLLTNIIVSPSCSALVNHLVLQIAASDVLPSTSLHWWTSFYVFNEVLSHILVFQNDKDVLNFGKSEILINSVELLKKFCLFIVKNGKSVAESIETTLPISREDFHQNCDIAFKLLNQLYIRNTRLQFVDDSVWTKDGILANGNSFSVETVAEIFSRHDFHDRDDEYDSGLTNGLLRNSTTPLSLRDESTILNILIYMPFLIPFEKRALIFQNLIARDKQNDMSPFDWMFHDTSAKITATISRENLLFDAFEAFGDLPGSKFKKKFDVKFVNQFGPESGIDGGGLTKEFLTSVCHDGFQYVNFDDDTMNLDSSKSAYNFFKQTPNTYQIYPSTDFYWRSVYQQQNTKKFGKLQPSYDFNEENQFFAKMMRFLGMVIGKCLYQNVLIDISFAPFFLSKWCSIENVASSSSPQYKSSFDDLKFLDEKLYQSLLKLLEMSNDQLEELDMNFTISERLPHESTVVTVDLIPNGSSVQVDLSNRLQYVYSIANFKLNTLINVQTKHFLGGLFEVIKPTWLNLFSHNELQILVSGGDNPLDIEDLKRNTVYGGYLENDKTVKLFWEVLEELSAEEKAKFIKFVTSSPKAPLLGFKELNPKFSIRDALDKNRLPTASTCVNLLKLPNYEDKEILREKLLYAINAESGFDLS